MPSTQTSISVAKKMHIRVAISLADVEIQFLEWCQKVGKLSTSGTCRLKIIVHMGIISGNMLKKVPKIAWLAKNVNKNLFK